MNEVVSRKTLNPLAQPAGGVPVPAVHSSTAVQMAAATREIEVMAQRAMMYPRDPKKCVDKLLAECELLEFAEDAIYEFTRGGSAIQDGTIRLAEGIARNWGGLRMGWRELHRDTVNGFSQVQAFCQDLENNNQESIEFVCTHFRTVNEWVDRVKTPVTKRLTEDREIYEHVGSYAKRRQRQCMFASVPRWVKDTAIQACKETLVAKADTSEENIQNLLDAYESVDVDRRQIEMKIGRDIYGMQPATLVRLRRTYKAIVDGITTPDAEFPPKDAIDDKRGPQQDKSGDRGAQAAASRDADLARRIGGGAAPATREETPDEPLPEASEAQKRENRIRHKVADWLGAIEELDDPDRADEVIEKILADELIDQERKEKLENAAIERRRALLRQHHEEGREDPGPAAGAAEPDPPAQQSETPPPDTAAPVDPNEAQGDAPGYETQGFSF